MNSPFASPYPQTPTPGGSSSALNHGRPPLTSLKPFGYPAQHSKPIPVPTPHPIPRKPHPLAQVSIMNSMSSESQHCSHDLSLDNTESDEILQSSLEHDLAELKRQPTQHHQPYAAQIMDDNGTDEDEEDEEDEDDQSQSPHDDDDDDDEEEDSQDQHSHSLSLRLGLSSLSPPGIGRFVPSHRRLSSAPMEPLDDELSSVARDFSRDLSALSLSPIRRPNAPTPLRALQDHREKIQQKEPQRTKSDDQPTPISAFEGLAQDLRRDFEHITGIPTQFNQPSTQANGTLRGTLPADRSGRARRVFGAEGANQAKSRPLQLHTAGLTSTPPPKTTRPAQAPPSSGGSLFKQINPTSRGQPNAVPSHHPTVKPSIHIVDASSDSAAIGHNKFMQHPYPHDGSLTAPAKSIVGNSVRVPDITGLTDALRSPEKAEFRQGLNRTGSLDPSRPDPTLNEALTLLRRRLTNLESENEACQGRIQELQDQLGRERRQSNGKQASGNESSIAGPPTERMVQKLKVYTRKLNHSIEAHAIALDELNAFKTRNKHVREDVGAVKTEVRQWSEEVGELKRGLEGLAAEVREIRTMIEGVMESREPKKKDVGPRASKPPTLTGMSRRGPLSAGLSKTQQEAKRQSRPLDHGRSQSDQTLLNDRSGIEAWRSQASSHSGRSFIGAEEIERLKNDLAHEESLRASRLPPKPRPRPPAPVPQPQNRAPAPLAPVAGPSRDPNQPTRVSSAPTLKKASALRTASLPKTVAQEISRAEAILKAVPRQTHDNSTCSECRRRRQENVAPAMRSSSAPVGVSAQGDKKTPNDGSRPPPQTVLVKIIHEIEDDFEIHRKIFVELSDTYRAMDPGSEDLGKRKVLAVHLKESVDTLEKKAEQIHELYRLLEVKDVPL